MATYFKFDKKIPHISYDDIYVKSGKIEDGKLVLSYSNEALDPVKIDLSAFNNFAYFDNAKLDSNSLVFSYFEKSGKKPVSVDLSSFDHYVSGIAISDDKCTLSLLYNDGSSVLTADASEWSKHVEDIALDDNVLCIAFNDMSSSISADFSKYDRKLLSVNTDNDVLTITDSKGDEISASLARYSVDHRVTDAKLLHDGRTLVLSMNGLPDISVDTTLLALNDFIQKAHLDSETLVLDYNMDKPSLSVDLSSLNTCVDSISVEDGKLVLKYANDRHEPISTDVSQLMQNWHLSGAAFDSKSNVLSLLMNTVQVPDMSVSLSSLAKDTFISEISTDTQNDVVNFIYNNQKIAGNINLQKYKNDMDIQSAHGVHDRAIQFVKGDGSYFNVSLSSAKSLSMDDNVLSLEFNDGKNALTADLSHLDWKIVNVMIDDDRLQLIDNYDRIISAKLPIHDTYVKQAEVVDGNLILTYNDIALPQLSTSLCSVVSPDTIVTSAYIDNDVLAISSSNGNVVTANLAKYNQFVTAFDLNELKNELSVVKSNGVKLAVSLDQFDKYISAATADDGKLVMEYNNGKGTLTADLSKYDCYVNKLEFNDSNNVMSLLHNNKKVAPSLTVDLSKLDRFNASASVDESNVLKIADNTGAEISAKLPIHDTYISAIGIDEDEDTMTFDYNVTEISAKSVNLRSYRKNDYIESGKYDPASKSLVLSYHKDPKFAKIDDLSISLPISGGSIIDVDLALDVSSSNPIANSAVASKFTEFTLDASLSDTSELLGKRLCLDSQKKLVEKYDIISQQKQVLQDSGYDSWIVPEVDNEDAPLQLTIGDTPDPKYRFAHNYTKDDPRYYSEPEIKTVRFENKLINWMSVHFLTKAQAGKYDLYKQIVLELENCVFDLQDTEGTNNNLAMFIALNNSQEELPFKLSIKHCLFRNGIDHYVMIQGANKPIDDFIVQDCKVEPWSAKCTEDDRVAFKAYQIANIIPSKGSDTIEQLLLKPKAEKILERIANQNYYCHGTHPKFRAESNPESQISNGCFITVASAKDQDQIDYSKCIMHDGDSSIGPLQLTGNLNVGIGNRVSTKYSATVGLSNTVLADYSFVEGANNFAGCYGLNILCGNYKDNYFIINSDISKIESTLSNAIGKKISYKLESNYTALYTVLSIDYRNNIISVDGMPDMKPQDGWYGKDSALSDWFCIELPEGMQYKMWFPENDNMIGDTNAGMYSHAEGEGCRAFGDKSHAEGEGCIADGRFSHAEGKGTRAGYAAHSEGRKTEALGEHAHSEGYMTYASGNTSHAAGQHAFADQLNSWVWNGNFKNNSGTTADDYHALSAGSFCINPKNGLSGFFIGNTSLNDIIDRKLGGIEHVLDEILG